MKKLKGFKKGFTLIELIVVIAIIAILAAIALPRLSKYLQDANEAKAEANARNAYAAAAAFNATNDITVNADKEYTFTSDNLQPYLDSNATIVATSEVDTAKEISVTFYGVGAEIPKTDNGMAAGTVAVDTYVVTVYNGTKTVTYGY